MGQGQLRRSWEGGEEEGEDFYDLQKPLPLLLSGSSYIPTNIDEVFGEVASRYRSFTLTVR